MFPTFKPEAMDLVFTPHYVGKSQNCGCRTLAGLPAGRLRHGDTVAWQPPAQFLCNPITVSGLTTASYHGPHSAQAESAVFLVINNTRKNLKKKVGSRQTKMETTLVLPLHTCNLPRPSPATQQ